MTMATTVTAAAFPFVPARPAAAPVSSSTATPPPSSGWQQQHFTATGASQWDPRRQACSVSSNEQQQQLYSIGRSSWEHEHYHGDDASGCTCSRVDRRVVRGGERFHPPDPPREASERVEMAFKWRREGFFREEAEPATGLA